MWILILLLLLAAIYFFFTAANRRSSYRFDPLAVGLLCLTLALGLPTIIEAFHRL